MFALFIIWLLGLQFAPWSALAKAVIALVIVIIATILFFYNGGDASFTFGHVHL